ncbi:hypothetical protein QBC42DRAFT_343926 [Cladorrhinum samala]|uniref:Uncharacterized protein n=1 Tax=Cladorrhinum samala TaxID=585594 RepID=A0AAV9I0H6_9PEZI|nr:hypothetical protein QBC42DRAFT_343926 [Cladorrhinum samala]
MVPDAGQTLPDQTEERPQSKDWEIFAPLVEDSELDAVPCIPNKPGEVHRVDLTGYDRPDVPCVRGRLFHVVHGLLSSNGEGGKIPATLIVFEWEFHLQLSPGHHRFRQVDIKVVFESAGDSPGGALNGHYAAPRVLEVAPRAPIKSLVRTRTVTPMAVGGKIALGFAPFVAVETSMANSAEGNTTSMTDYRLITGIPVFSTPDSSHADAATWTLHENESLKSGVQSPVRTAVLVERQAGDCGKFSATVKTKAELSSLRARAAEKFRKWTGLVPVDDKVYFDAGVGRGAAVIGGRKHWVDRQPSPCDAGNLETEDLLKFLIKDED